MRLRPAAAAPVWRAAWRRGGWGACNCMTATRDWEQGPATREQGTCTGVE